MVEVGMVEIRNAVADDAPRMTAIYIDSWNRGFGHLMGVRPLTQERVDRMRDDVTRVDVEWTVAELDGEIVGFAEVGPSRDPIDPRTGELHSIAVHPSYWRRGIGRALMIDALDRLRASWSRAILWTPANYERGHAFYRATGWRPLGRSRADGKEVAFGRRL
jgi:GNAT superfamily N-acetyltransferase